MPNLERRSLIAGASFISAAAVARAALAGDLNPPQGAVAPTGRSLKDVEPRTPISSLPSSPDAVHVISQAGSYYLTEELVVPSGSSGIVVVASGPVAIDMRGFTIRGAPGSHHAVQCVSSSCTYLEISDGFIADLDGDGIDGADATVTEVHDVHVTSVGGRAIAANQGLCVTECRVESCGSHGLIWSPRSNVGVIPSPVECIIDDCESSKNGGDGLRLFSDGSVPNMIVVISDSEFHGNVGHGAGGNFGGTAGLNGNDLASVTFDELDCSSNGGAGIFLQAPPGPLGTSASVVVECGDCTCARNGSHGISLSTCEVAVCDCDCVGNGGHGVHLDGVSGSVECCLCSKNTLCGLSASNVDASIDEMECRSNGSHGMECTGLTGSVEYCECSSNSGDGMHISSMTGSVECCLCCKNGGSGMSATGLQGAIDEVDCRTNGSSGMACSGLSGSIDECDCSSNAGAGIHLSSASTACVCCCTCRSNVGEGIFAAADCGGLSISECDAQSNSTGIRVDSSGAILLWNTARGNAVAFAVDASNPTVVLTGADLLVNNSPHANYAF